MIGSLSHRCFEPACQAYLVRKPRDAPLMLVVSRWLSSFAGFTRHQRSKTSQISETSETSETSPSPTTQSLYKALYVSELPRCFPDAQYRSCASDFHGRAVV